MINERTYFFFSYSNMDISRESNPLGYEKTVGRLRFGLEETKRKKEALEK